MIKAIKQRRSVSDVGLGTVDPSSLMNADLWPSPEEPVYPMGTPSDPFLAAGSASSMSLPPAAKPLRVTKQRQPETPLRRGNGQSMSSVDIVTPQSASRSFSMSALAPPYTPAGSQKQYPLMSPPLDTPLATPSDHVDAFFKPGYFMPSGDMSEDQLLPSDFGLGKHAHSVRSESVLSSLDGTFDSLDERFDSVSSSGSPKAIMGHMDMSQIDLPHMNMAHLDVNGMEMHQMDMHRMDMPEMDAHHMDAHHMDMHRMDMHHMDMSQIEMSQIDLPAMSPLQAPLEGSVMMDAHGPQPGVNPFYNPPSYLRRTRSEVANYHPQLDSAAWDSTDAGVGDAEPRGRSHSIAVAITGERGVRGDDASCLAPQKTVTLLNSSPRRSSSATHLALASVNDLSSEEKPYTCEECKRCFRRMEHLRRHMKTHTRERPYPCTVPGCDRRFSRTDNLKAHILTHAKKTGRNLYVEGLAELQETKPVKRRRSRKPTDPIPA